MWIASPSFAVPFALYVLLEWLHPKAGFQQVVIGSQTADEPGATLAEMARVRSALILRFHIEMIVLTLFAIAFLYVPFRKSRIPGWAKGLLMVSAMVSLAACFLQW